MGYIYYKEVVKAEHLLFAEEIQKYLGDRYHYDISVTQIHSFYREYAKSNCAYEQLYYKTRNGLKKVYSLDIITDKLIFHC